MSFHTIQKIAYLRCIQPGGEFLVLTRNGFGVGLVTRSGFWICLGTIYEASFLF